MKGSQMIKSIDQLKLKLLDMSETERLDRHALVEVSLAEKTDKITMLEKALKQSQLECAGIRSQLQTIVDENSKDEWDLKAEAESRAYYNDLRAE